MWGRTLTYAYTYDIKYRVDVGTFGYSQFWEHRVDCFRVYRYIHDFKIVPQVGHILSVCNILINRDSNWYEIIWMRPSRLSSAAQPLTCLFQFIPSVRHPWGNVYLNPRRKTEMKWTEHQIRSLQRYKPVGDYGFRWRCGKLKFQFYFQSSASFHV